MDYLSTQGNKFKIMAYTEWSAWRVNAQGERTDDLLSLEDVRKFLTNDRFKVTPSTKVSITTEGSVYYKRRVTYDHDDPFTAMTHIYISPEE